MNILSIFRTENIRTRLAQKNIVFLFINKLAAALISLQLIPATIGYVNADQYGIWITLSSIVAWIVYFDMGLTHGFRNGFATAKANGNNTLAKDYVSTTYAILSIVFTLVMLLCLILNQWLSWSSVFMVDTSLDKVLHKVFVVLIVFFSLQMVFNLFTTLLLADQKPGISALVVTLGQFFSLLVVYILTLTTDGNLVYLAFALIGVPTITLLLVTFIFFKTTLKEYTPSFSNINWGISKDIFGLGSKFFVIQLSMLFVFQFSNFIMLRVLGAESVTMYTIVFRYFSMIYIVMGIIFVPFWSAFTDAYAKGDLSWMKKTYSKLSKIWVITIFLFVFLLVISPYVYRNWLAKNIDIDWKLSVAVGLNMIILSRANLYMVCLNGIGKVFMQMVIYLCFAIISIPLMFLLTNLWGYNGVVFVSSVVYLCQAISGHLQLKMIFNGRERGIWSR